MTKSQINFRASALTRRQLETLARRWGTTQSETLSIIVDRVYQQEQQERQMDTSIKTAVILEALEACRRGVQEPTIVREESGFAYIPGAYLTDISYQGSRDVVTVVDEESFGDGFNLATATAAELLEAAEWAAETWEW